MGRCRDSALASNSCVCRWAWLLALCSLVYISLYLPVISLQFLVLLHLFHLEIWWMLQKSLMQYSGNCYNKLQQEIFLTPSALQMHTRPLPIEGRSDVGWADIVSLSKRHLKHCTGKQNHFFVHLHALYQEQTKQISCRIGHFCDLSPVFTAQALSQTNVTKEVVNQASAG